MRAIWISYLFYPEAGTEMDMSLSSGAFPNLPGQEGPHVICLYNTPILFLHGTVTTCKKIIYVFRERERISI